MYRILHLVLTLQMALCALSGWDCVLSSHRMTMPQLMLAFSMSWTFFMVAMASSEATFHRRCHLSHLHCRCLLPAVFHSLLHHLLLDLFCHLAPLCCQALFCLLGLLHLPDLLRLPDLFLHTFLPTHPRHPSLASLCSFRPSTASVISPITSHFVSPGSL